MNEVWVPRENDLRSVLVVYASPGFKERLLEKISEQRSSIICLVSEDGMMLSGLIVLN